VEDSLWRSGFSAADSVRTCLERPDEQSGPDANPPPVNSFFPRLPPEKGLDRRHSPDQPASPINLPCPGFAVKTGDGATVARQIARQLLDSDAREPERKRH